MASGKVHAAANVALLGVTVVGVPFLLPLPLAAGAIVGATLGVITTPDIDMAGIMTHEERRIYKNFGFFGGGMWQLFWNHYAQTHSHRGSSHAPITGTLGRWKYVIVRLGWLLLPVLYYYGEFVLDYWFECLSVVYVMFIFNCLQDIIHLCLDGWKYHSGQ